MFSKVVLRILTIPISLPDDVHDVFKATEEEGAKCGLLLVRAGIFMKSECLDALSSYLATNINVKLIIFSLPSDFLPLNEFVTALNSFGKENVILDLPKVVLQKVQNLAGNAAFEADFDANDDGHSGAVQMSSNPIVRLLFMALLNYAK